MHSKIVYSVVICLLILLASAGCAKKKEPVKTEPVKRTTVPMTTVTKPIAKREAPMVQTQEAAREIPAPSTKPITEEKILWSFEGGDMGGWEIPSWALEKDDQVAENIEVSADIASEGRESLKIDCDFPGAAWTAAIVELEQYMDFTPYRDIAVDIYIPKDAPLGLRAKMILTVGEDWTFTEMTRTVPLVPGEWTKVNASIETGSYEWKRTIVDEAFRQDVRKIVIRIESNKRPVYKGPVYIDNVRIGK